MGILEDGEEALRQWRRASLTVDATYNGLPIPVTQASTSVDTEMTGSLIVNSKTVDWIVDKELLPTPPRPGDLITVAGVQYEAMALNGEKCWRWHGRNNSSYRIHSKAVS